MTPTNDSTPADEPARVYGPEQWATVAGQDWSWWDLWCCVIAVRDHDGDLSALAGEIAARIRNCPPMTSRDSDDARLSHLLDLDRRLRATGLAATDLAGPTELANRKIGSRARAKLKGSIPTGAHARTPAMLDLPADRLRRRARFGHWASFPTDPTPFYDKFRPTVDRRGWVTEHQTYRATGVLSDRLARLDGPRRSVEERLSLYRAFYTAAVEFADIADDSSGYLGGLRTEMWLEYLTIDWRATGMTPRHYWQDLCELCVWEDYAVDHGHERTWFRGARPDETDQIERVLNGLADELHSFVLDYRARQATGAAATLPHRARSRRR